MAQFHVNKHNEWMLKLSKCPPDQREADGYKVGDEFPLYADELKKAKDATAFGPNYRRQVLNIAGNDATHVFEMIDLKFGPMQVLNKEDYDRAKRAKETKSEIILVFKKKNVNDKDRVWVVSEISKDFVENYEKTAIEGDATPINFPEFNTGDDAKYRAGTIVFYKRVLGALRSPTPPG